VPRYEKAPLLRETAPSRRLGYKRERLLAELPRKIEALQAEIATLHQALADPDLYRRDATSFAAKTARLNAAQADLETAENEWLELEMLREELEGL
jgi:ATP-binding cassette subfamily F protein uup